MNKKDVKNFQKQILEFYTVNGRKTLPWRVKQTFYFVLVSEVMLQQTQVERVIPKFLSWIKTYPDFNSLSQAKLSDILIQWKGLGYQRRAKALHQISKILKDKSEQELQSMTLDELLKLPGIGPYTARAIKVFVYKEIHTFVETNIRTVFAHFFFKDKENISDSEILKLVRETLYVEDTALWYAALMDYGSFLKKNGIKINNKSKHYNKQKPYKGSNRELRAKILFFLTTKNCSKKDLLDTFTDNRTEKVLSELIKEGFIKIKSEKLFIS